MVIRGSGIVASRILQRLIDDRDRHGAQTQIVHVFRTYVDRRPRPERLHAAPGRRRLGLPGLQLPEVGVGRPAEEPDASAGGRRPRGALQGHRRHQHPGPQALAGAAGARPARGLVPHRDRARCSRSCRPTRAGRSRGSRPADGVLELRAQLRHRLHRPRGRHRRAPALRRPARAQRRRTQPARPSRRRAHLRGPRAPPAGTAACTPRARRPSAATSPASTRSSACRSRRRRSPTTWPGRASASGSGRSARSASGCRWARGQGGLSRAPDPERTPPDPDLPDRRRRRALDAGHLAVPARRRRRSRTATAPCTPFSPSSWSSGWRGRFVYHLLQQFRWEKDWPTLFALLVGVPEGLAGVRRRAQRCPARGREHHARSVRRRVRHHLDRDLAGRQRADASAQRPLAVPRRETGMTEVQNASTGHDLGHDAGDARARRAAGLARGPRDPGGRPGDTRPGCDGRPAARALRRGDPHRGRADGSRGLVGRAAALSG